jgi:hypothetical protein
MSIRITKPFTPFNEEEVARLPGHMGVFELGDENGNVLYIGFAGGLSLFGLRGELRALIGNSSATGFRCEVNTAYLTRYQELLMAHVAEHDRLPVENSEDGMPTLGRLSPG